MHKPSMFELSDLLRELRDLKKEKESEMKELSTKIEELERHLIDHMVEEEMSSFKRNGCLFSLVSQEYPSAVIERKDQLYECLKEQGFGDLFTVNSQTLSATVKDLMARNEGHVPEWLNGLIKISEKTSIRIRKG